MKTTKMLTILILALGLMVCTAELARAAPVGTAFTYQGRLIDANDTADGEYDLQFKLFDDVNVVDGNQVGSDVNVPDLDVIDGYFTAELDFGSVFDGNDCYLEISVRPGDSNDPNAFVTLSPRQKVTPTPYALYALSGNEGPQGPQGPKGDRGDPGSSYRGLEPINVDNANFFIGLNPATQYGDLIVWDGSNWIFSNPELRQDQFNRDNMQPFLGVNFIIALQGVYPSPSAETPFIAEIIMFAGNFAPRNWAFCNGQLLAISSNPALFSLLGTTYGGDGHTTFALPDLRGRVPLHPGTGPGLTPRSLGGKGGSETVLDTNRYLVFPYSPGY
jgi:microcystin-dependent protein